MVVDIAKIMGELERTRLLILEQYLLDEGVAIQASIV